MRAGLLVVLSVLTLASALRLESGSPPPLTPKGAAIPKYRLNDGKEMPALGLGVYRIKPGKSTYEAVTTALDLGYRLIDTARMYGNEADVGRAVRDSGIPRSEVFIVTKLWDDAHGFDKALAAGRRSNERLDLGYIDLYLMHSPGQFSIGGGKIVETYDAMLELQKEGIVRSVGVSNFGVKHLEALEQYGRPAPAVNQFEVHPLMWEERKEVVQYCRDNKILVQAYGSVLSGHDDLMEKATSMVSAEGKTAAQVLLRWAIEQGFQVIPKSTHRDHQEENMDIFDFSLTPEEVESLNSYGGKLPDYWDPLSMPVDVGAVSAP